MKRGKEKRCNEAAMRPVPRQKTSVTHLLGLTRSPHLRRSPLPFTPVSNRTQPSSQKTQVETQQNPMTPSAEWLSPKAMASRRSIVPALIRRLRSPAPVAVVPAVTIAVAPFPTAAPPLLLTLFPAP